MKDLELHHFAHRIAKGSLEFVIELFEQMGFFVSYREKDARWAMIKQKSVNVDIQLIETDDKPLKTDIKTNCHIAFLSDNPEKEVERIKEWIESKNRKFVQGKWSDKEFWFDLPEIFIDFVIEVMNTSIIK